MSRPLRDPLAEPSDEQTTTAAGPSTSGAPASGAAKLSLGLPRSKGGRPSHTVAAAQAAAPAPTGLELRRRHEEDSIRATDNDAIASRLSAMQAGYLDKEPWSDLFYAGPSSSSSSSSSSSPPPMAALNPPPLLRRPPIINIGTYLRCKSIDRVVETFLQSTRGPKQIVSLGAGSDARFWRVHSDPNLSPQLAHYLELDFPTVTARKLASIRRQGVLSDALGSEGSATPDGAGLVSPRYALRGCDLRNIVHGSQSIGGDDVLSSLDPSRPTLVLAECVLSYMPPEDSVGVLGAIGRRVNADVPLAAVCYEMCVAGDGAGEGGESVGKFGQTMLKNLETRGLSLSGARAYRTPASHVERLRQAFTLNRDTPCHAASLSLARIYSQSLSQPLRSRINRIEGLDEVEELQMLLACYAVSWAVRDQKPEAALSSQLGRALETIE